MAHEDRPVADSGPAETPAQPEPATTSTDAPSVTQTPAPPRKTVAGRVWVAIIVAAILLIALIIFIAENSQNVTISFLGAHGTISLALAILIAAVAGVLISVLVGSTRIVQLRLEVQRHRRAASARRVAAR
jgi:lipopolysaccharide assembly protein A